MIQQVLLQKDGAMICGQRRVESEPVIYLGAPVMLAPDYRFRSVFMLMETYPLLAKLNPFLPSVIERYRAAPRKIIEWEGIDFLELNKNVEIIGYPGNPRLEIYTSIRAKGKTGTRSIRSADLEMLLDLPIWLGKLRHVIFGDQVDELEFETVFTLFEFIEGIAWELSFLGTPRECTIRTGGK